MPRPKKRRRKTVITKVKTKKPKKAKSQLKELILSKLKIWAKSKKRIKNN